MLYETPEVYSLEGILSNAEWCTVADLVVNAEAEMI